MACERFANTLKARALGAPLPADAAAHLAICANCQAAIDAEARLLAIIDHALDEVGSVRPAPGLIPRLRAHVEQPMRWAPAWLTAAAVAAAAVLVAAVIAGRATRDDPAVGGAPAPPPVQRTAEAAAATASGAPVKLRPPATTRKARVARPMAVTRERVAETPEVLVPMQERQAVGRLFEALRAGRPDVVASLMRLHDGGSVTEPKELAIAPIQIEPVVVSALPLSAPILDK